MDEVERSPKVLDVSWGRIEVEGFGVGEDVKLFPGGGREWDWTETGTRHSPGIQAADVEELVHRGVTVIVLSQGMDKQLEVEPDTLSYLDQRSITVHVAETREAVRIYNSLVEVSVVGGLFHSTC